MDMYDWFGVITAVLMLIFVAIVIWAFSRARRRDFEAAARLPLEDDSRPPPGKEQRGS